MTYRALFKFNNLSENAKTEYEKNVETFLKYVNAIGWEYTVEDMENAIKNDYLTDHETDDGRAFFHYLDDIFEFVVRPGEILDGDDMKEYTKYIY